MKLDWANLPTKLGIKGSTAQALAAFKKRNDDARRKVQILSEQPQKVDFAAYRSQLRNTAVIDDLEKQLSSFQPKKYDVSRQLKAIEAFEAQAVKSAEATKGKVDAELQDLEKTLKNIETARPFEDLTVVCICSKSMDVDVMFLSRDQTDANVFYRTRLWLLAQTSTSVSRSSYPRAAGKSLATRRSSATFPSSRWEEAWCSIRQLCRYWSRSQSESPSFRPPLY